MAGHSMTLSAADIAAIKACANAAADAARVETLKHFRTPALTSENKDMAGFDPVTVADRAAEAAIRAVIAQYRPHDAILGEEEGATAGTSGLTWVIDPIDGTRGFISGTPTWGVLIAVSDEDGPIYGIVDQPYIGERFKGGLGVSEFTGPHSSGPLSTRATSSLSDAILFTTFPEVGTNTDRQGFEAVASQVKLVRYGMDCYAYALLAAGQVDLVIEAGLHAYDIQGPIAVVQAAGGIVTNWMGEPAHNGGQAVAAATPALHAMALAILRDFADAG